MQSLENLTLESNLNKHVVIIPDGHPVTMAAVNFTSFIFPFENYDHVASGEWFRNHWQISIYISTVYIVSIFFGQWVMKDRPSFQLSRPLLYWNIGLALFSIIGFVRSFQDQVNQFSLLAEDVGGSLRDGVVRSFCRFDHTSVVGMFWGCMFTLSKVPELLDTAFVVLRKGKLIFLHWYHHATVLVSCWYVFGFYDPCSRWTIVMNFLVHSLMYSYYALKALGLKVPKGVAMTITILQILQMWVGLFLNLYTFYLIKVVGDDCRRHLASAYVAAGIYLSYFLLFMNFFYKAYFGRGRTSSLKIKSS